MLLAQLRSRYETASKNGAKRPESRLWNRYAVSGEGTSGYGEDPIGSTQENGWPQRPPQPGIRRI